MPCEWRIVIYTDAVPAPPRIALQASVPAIRIRQAMDREPLTFDSVNRAAGGGFCMPGRSHCMKSALL